jgi:hypothetical protein
MVEILFDFENCITGCLVISILLLLVSGYAYLVNRRYSSNDPARKDYDFRAVFLAPITWPFLFLFGFFFTIIKAIFFGIFLLVFSIAVAVIRKPFFWPWIEPSILRIGRGLLKMNTFLIRLFDRDS